MEKILIIDDSEVSRAILCELFHGTYDILEAANGLEAMSILSMQRDEIDLLLLDIVMPVMDGFQVLQALNDQGLIQMCIRDRFMTHIKQDPHFSPS